MLWLKLRREIIRSPWQFTAAVLIMVLGIVMFSASYMSYLNLNESYQYSYEVLHFADYWISLPGLFPRDAVTDALEAEGVERGEARLVLSLPAEVMSSTRPKAYLLGVDLSVIEEYLPRREEGPVRREPKRLELRILSVPDRGRPEVNDLLVVRGEYASSPDEIMLEYRVADYHELEVGDEVTLFAPDGRERAFKIAAVVRSPEFIWVARSRQDIFPSPDTFGVAFVPESGLAEFLFAGGEMPVNELVFTVSDPAAGEAVLDALPKGATLTERAHQVSHEVLQLDLDGYRQLAIFFPALFLGVGAMVLYVLQARTVHAQRWVIGTMRAMGYSRGAIMVHYLAYALLAGLLGSAIGAITGLLVSRWITELYVAIIGIPLVRTVPQYGVLAAAMAFGLITGALGGIIPARAAASLLPAEAMRESPAAAGKRPWLERVFPPLARLRALAKVGYRDLFRNPRRSLYSVLGVAVATSLILVSSVLLDSVDWAMRHQFEDIERYDVMASFYPGAPPEVLDELADEEGVRAVQGVVEVPVELHFAEEVYTTALRGLEPGEHLYDLRPAGIDDADLEATAGSSGLRGIVLAASLGQRFGVSQGDIVEVESLLDHSVRRFEVLGFAEVPLGALVFGERDAVARSFDLPELYTTVFLTVDGDRERLIKDLESRPGVVSVLDQANLRDTVRQLLRMAYAFIGVMLLLGGLLALAVVFTTTMVSILERERELATMRILGTPSRAVAWMVSLQGLVLGAVGLFLGAVLGQVLASVALGMWGSDLFDFQVVTYPRTYVVTGLGMLGILLLSGMPALRRLAGLNLAEVAKRRED